MCAYNLRRLLININDTKLPYFTSCFTFINICSILCLSQCLEKGVDCNGRYLSGPIMKKCNREFLSIKTIPQCTMACAIAWNTPS